MLRKKMPNTYKYNRRFLIRAQKGRNDIAFPFLRHHAYGLVVLDTTYIIYPEIYSFVKHLKKKLTKKSQIIVNVSLNIPITRKPVGARMGKGKGPNKDWISLIHKGQLLAELPIHTNADLIKVKFALEEAKHKLSVPTRLVKLTF